MSALGHKRTFGEGNASRLNTIIKFGAGLPLALHWS